MKLTGKVVLITGGGRGIGKAVALAYAREGARLAVCARTKTEIEETAAEVRALGGECAALACDVSLEDSAAETVKSVERQFGGVDVLVNNAGVMTRPTPIMEFDVKKWDYTIAVNLRGSFLMAKGVLPLMARKKSGSIINVSSSFGRGGYPDFGAYVASKWAVEGFTQTLAAEVRSSNIRVNSVDPGYVATKLTRFRGGRPESVTDVFVFLASDESKGVTGRMLSSSDWKSEIRQRQG
jgi:NAD(P)-dependent dehydrogenase (short-subunit alcohol dehydrogenase family)